MAADGCHALTLLFHGTVARTVTSSHGEGTAPPYELAFNKGRMITNIEDTADPDYKLGNLDGRRGVFPLRAVEVVSERMKAEDERKINTGAKKEGAAKKAELAADPAALAKATQDIHGQAAKCLVEYNVETEGHIHLKPGGLVHEITEEGAPEGYFMGTSAGAKGLFPIRCVLLVTHIEAATILLNEYVKPTGLNDGMVQSMMLSLALPTMDGFMERKTKGIRGNWKRQFYILEGVTLSYYNTNEDEKPQGAFDVGTPATVKAVEADKKESDRQFRLEIATADGTVILVRTDSQQEREEWVKALQDAQKNATAE